MASRKIGNFTQGSADKLGIRVRLMIGVLEMQAAAWAKPVGRLVGLESSH